LNPSLLDTDILSYFLKGNIQVGQKVDIYLGIHPKLQVSEITYFEILAGLTFKKASKQIIEFENFISTCNILKLSNQSLRSSAKIYAELRDIGITIGSADLLIAGTAIANNLILVTNNQKHYRPISTLKTSNWNTQRELD